MEEPKIQLLFERRVNRIIKTVYFHMVYYTVTNDNHAKWDDLNPFLLR